MSVTVEVADLTAASRTLASSVADPLFDRVPATLAPLQSTGGMAGDDPPALHWARDYDSAAAVAITAAEDVINACYRVSAMLGASARNYANAERASTVPGHRPDPAVAAAIAGLPSDTHIGIPSHLPSASAGAGGSDAPPGWHFVVHHLGGYVWPNGHQDRLHRAAGAWHASARALESYAFDATIVDLGPLVDRLPEGRDIATVCMGLGDHLQAVARAHRGLGDACSRLAHHIDDAHARVRHEIVEFVEWSAGIETVGAIASIFTFGAAEAPTTGAELSRILATAAAIRSILAEFTLAVRALALSIGPVADAAADVRAAVAWLRELRIVEAEVSGVPGLRVYSVVRDEGAAARAATSGVTAETAETAALTRLSEAADTAASRVSLVKVPPTRVIEDPKLLNPESLRGVSAEGLEARIPPDWEVAPATNGEGTVYNDPLRKGRQIRIMKPYPPGTRPDLITEGPYAVISQNGRRIKVPLAGNPVLP